MQLKPFFQTVERFINKRRIFMEKSRVPVFVFTLLTVVALPIIAFVLLLAGAVGEALAVALTLGHAETDGEILKVFLPFAYLSLAATPFALAGGILGFIKKEAKGLKIAAGATYAVAAIIMLVLVVLTLVKSIQLDSAPFGIAFCIIYGLIAAVFILGALFRGFLRLEKKAQ